MGVKGFQKGHFVSKETREKISKANNGNFFTTCDYSEFNGIHKGRDKSKPYKKRNGKYILREVKE